MKLRTTLKRVYFPVLLATILLSLTFRIAAIFANYNFKTGFFENKILINIASVIVIAGAVFTFTYVFTGSKKNKLIADFSTPATYVPTGALSVAMIFFATLTFIQSSKTGFSIREFMALPGVTYTLLFRYIANNMSAFVLKLMGPMAILSVGYFILNACVLKRGPSLRAFFGTANVLFLAFYTSFLYFDTATLARNAPNKIVDQMAFLFAALFFLYEIRISLGREKWNLYLAFGFIAAILTAYSSIPSLVVYFIDGHVISNNIQENVLSFALFVFILSRILLAAFLKEDKESESISAIREYSRERKEYIKEKEELARKAYMELYQDIRDDFEAFVDEDINAVQLSLNETIDTNESLNGEFAETALFVPDEVSLEIEPLQNAESAPEFIQETILFPEETEAFADNEENSLAEDSADEESDSKDEASDNA